MIVNCNNYQIQSTSDNASLSLGVPEIAFVLISNVIIVNYNYYQMQSTSDNASLSLGVPTTCVAG